MKNLFKFQTASSFILVLSLCFASIRAFGMPTKPLLFQISGFVTDVNKQPIETGNVLILHTRDSSLITGDLFFDGAFSIANIEETNFLLAIKAIGYVTKYIEINRDPDQDSYTLDPFSLAGVSLEEVVVVAQRLPAFRQEGGMVVVDVQNNVFNRASTAIDILKKAPRVMVNDQEISIFGKGKAIVLLNGKKVFSTDILSSIPGSEISKIEIISNPSAKYDAEGQAVINIITKKNDMEGFDAEIRTNITKRTHLSYLYGGGFSYKKGDWNIYGSYENRPHKILKTDDYERTFTGGSDPIFLDQKVRALSNFKTAHRPKLAAIYQHKKHEFGVEYNATIYDANFATSNRDELYQNNALEVLLSTTKDGTYDYARNSFNFNYTYTPDTTGKKLFLTVDHTYANAYFTERISENTSTESIEKLSKSQNRIPIDIAQLDYSTPIGQSRINMEAGIKYTRAQTKDNIVFSRKMEENNFEVDPDASNTYQYKEEVSAAYIGFQRDGEKIDANFSLRAEATNAKGSSSSHSIVDTFYVNLFPSLSVDYHLAKDLDVGASLSTRIKRPTLQDLDPFVVYLDSFSIIKGNPGLHPEITHSIEANVTYKKYASINFGFSSTDNAIFPVIHTDEQSAIAILQNENIEKYQRIFANINLPYQTNKWTTFNSFGYEKKNVSYYSNGNEINVSAPMWYAYMYNRFSLPWNFNAEVTFTYASSGIEGVFSFESIYQLSAGISRSFLEDNLNISVYYNDILKSNRYKGEAILPSLNVQYNSYYDSSKIRLAATYKIGKYKNHKTNKSRNETLRRIDIK